MCLALHAFSSAYVNSVFMIPKGKIYFCKIAKWNTKRFRNHDPHRSAFR